MIRTEITGIGDPFILRVGDTYYMYATNAADGFRYYTSQNLTDWTDCGYCYKNSPWGEDSFWAPEVYERGGKYYLLYTARWKKNHSLRIGLAVADSPAGEFKDVTDGPLFDFGYAAIDATVLHDDDGKDYIYYSRDCSENVIDGVHTSQIYAAEISSDLRTFLTEPVLVSTPCKSWELLSGDEWRWNEGPYLVKHNGKYYMNFSVNCYASREYSVAYSVADKPLGPFIKADDNPILTFGEGDFSGPGHNAIFEGKDGKLYTAFHIHTHPEAPSGNRRACIGEVQFTNDDKMKIIV